MKRSIAAPMNPLSFSLYGDLQGLMLDGPTLFSLSIEYRILPALSAVYLEQGQHQGR